MKYNNIRNRVDRLTTRHDTRYPIAEALGEMFTYLRYCNACDDCEGKQVPYKDWKLARREPPIDVEELRTCDSSIGGMLSRFLSC